MRFSSATGGPAAVEWTPCPAPCSSRILVLAIAAHVLFWRWKLRAPGGQDELLEAVAADGWRLVLGRRRPRGAPRVTPVLLVHGIAMNRQALDFGVERWSLAAALAAAGLDCFALDLRGHGGSRRRPPGVRGHWTLDDYLALDVPAALDAIERVTGAAARPLGRPQPGGAARAGGGAAVPGPDRRRGGAGAAHPAAAGGRRSSASSAGLARWRLLRPLAELVAPLSGWWQPRRAGLGASSSATWSAPSTGGFMMNAIEEMPPGVVGHFQRLARRAAHRPLRRERGLARGAGRLPPAGPLRGGAARRAGAQAAAWRPGSRSWGGEKTLLVAAPEVGHTDLVLGKRAPAELFPAVRDWLTARSPLR